jgi:hypothetical protein
MQLGPFPVCSIAKDKFKHTLEAGTPNKSQIRTCFASKVRLGFFIFRGVAATYWERTKTH